MRKGLVRQLDFGVLAGLIPDKPTVVPCDIDMIYERKGHFLIGEWKDQEETLSRGQEIMLHRLATTPKFTVLLIYGYTYPDTTIHKIYLFKDFKLELLGEGTEKLKEIIVNWWKRVDK